MELSGEFESIVNETRGILGEALISMRLFTSDGIILYSDSKGSVNEDFLVASGSAIVEISRIFSTQLGFEEEPIVILAGKDSFILIKRVQDDVILMLSIRGSYAQRYEEIAGVLGKIREFLK
ncbi:MAG: hypothetical protein NZ992_06515 [Candidatus Korarchaeum sp.]|nr:hypothetical protein [Candidatus Korarchaeum sp.]